MATITKDKLAKNVAAAIIAQKAVVAAANKAKDKNVPPTKINEVLKFQTTEGTLSKDGLYGPNAVAALKFYLQKTSNPKVPPAAIKFINVKTTWKAPTLAADPKPVATKPAAKSSPTKPAAKPVAVKSSVPKAISKEQLTKTVAAAMIAQKAVTSLANKAKDKKVPATKIKEVLSFQTTEGTLVKDGLYGPNVITALKFYLQKTSNPKVPPCAAKFTSSKVTWKAPPLAPGVDTTKPIAAKAATPTPAPAPAPKSKPKPFSSTKKVVAAKVKKPILKSKGGLAAKIPKPPPYGQELHTIKPKHDAEEKVVARVNGVKPPKTKPRDVEESLAATKISSAAASAITPALKEIKQKILRQDLQTQATSEHRAINKEDNFKRDVLTKLNDIKEKIYGSNNSLSRFGGERRILGLIL